MDKTIKLLGGLLAAQLLLALWVFSGDADLSAQRPEEPLFAFDAASVTGVKVEGPDGATVTLAKSNDTWILPDAWKVPARGVKLQQLLKRLQDLKKGLAVATTPGAQTRFEVAADKFQRRITLTRGDDVLGTLYLGTSPGMRKIHARMTDDEAVYSVAFAAYETPFKTDDWLDSALVRIADSELESIEVEGLELSKSNVQNGEKDGAKIDIGWAASGLADSEQLDQSKALELAREINQLEVREVLGTEVNAEYRLDAPQLKLNLRRSDGEPITWTLSKPENGDDYVLKSSEHPWYFEVASWTAKPLLEIARRDALIVSPEPADAAQTSAAPGIGDVDQVTESAGDDPQGSE